MAQFNVLLCFKGISLTVDFQKFKNALLYRRNWNKYVTYFFLFSRFEYVILRFLILQTKQHIPQIMGSMPQTNYSIPQTSFWIRQTNYAILQTNSISLN